MAQIVKDASPHARSIRMLVPGATNPTADFHPNGHILTLHAHGTSSLYLYDFQFVSEPLPGGYMFSLQCRSGPAILEQPWSWTQSFTVPYAPPHFVPRVVIIRDGEHPQGQKVVVKWPVPIPDDPPTALTNAAPKDIGPVMIPEPITIHAICGKNFQLDANAANTGVAIDFDKKYLQLENAGIDVDGRIFWVLNPIKLGKTQAVITYTSDKAILGNKRYFNIDIFLLGIGPAAAPDDKGKDQAVLSFLGGVNLAVRKIHAKWPKATLYDIDCQIPCGQHGPVDSAYDLGQLTALFRSGGEGDEEGTIRISTLGGWWSDWGNPTFKKGPIVGPGTIKWPPSADTWDVGLEDAVHKLEEVVHKKFWSCDLFQALKPPEEGPVQPLYAFTMEDHSVWSVGAKDGEVTKVHDPIDIEAVD